MKFLLSIFAGLLLMSTSVYADMGTPTSTTPTSTTPSPVKIARDLIKQGQYTEALVGLKEAIGKDPADADLLSLAGFSYRRLQKIDEAFDYYNRALSQDPEHKGALNYLGILYLNTGQPEKARELLKRLDDACFFTCDEYIDLKTAIEAGSAPEW